MTSRLPMVLLIGLALPFVHKPVHVDDANFLAMARTAAIDPWRPHAFAINWGGQTERAFDVLSNPPGIALWLAPVVDQPVLWMHLWMLPWLLLAVWGAHRLGQRVAGRPQAAALLIAGAPVAMLATHAFTPDLPLLALSLAGVAGLLDDRRPMRARWPAALCLGAAALFRYSGIALIPLAVLWPWLNGERRAAITLGLAAAAPLTLLMVHDLLAYGAIHMFAMVGFQSTANAGADLAHKLVSNLAYLGGTAVLPLLALARPLRGLVGAAAGGLVGYLVIASVGGATPVWVGTVFAAAGGASLSVLSLRVRPLHLFLGAWLMLGLGLLLALRFSAARYWIPFYAPVVLLALVYAPRWLTAICIPASLGLGLALASDDLDLAETQERAAVRAMDAGTGRIAGHWGFQHHLEAAGWTPVEEDQALPPATWVAISKIAWPQLPSNSCWDFMEVSPLPDPRPGLRVLSHEAGANIHGNFIAGPPSARVYAPWSLADDPMDQLTVRRTCP